MNPTGTDLTRSNIKAQNIADACHTAYWMESASVNCQHNANYQRKKALDDLHQLAALFGYTLTAVDAQEVAA